MKKRLLTFLFLFFAVALLCPFLLIFCTAAPNANSGVKNPAYVPARTITHNGLRYVNIQDVARFYNLKVSLTKGGPLLYSSQHRIVFQNGKRSGTINNVAVTFYYPPLEKNGRVYIAEIDYLKIIYPLLSPKLPYRRLYRIMLDPGHGGKDQGAPGPVLPEKTLTLQIAKKLQTALKSYGFEVLMTRTIDNDLSLDARTKMCAKYKPDLYISIHCNAAANKSVTGIETWYLGAMGGASAHGGPVKNVQDKGNAYDEYSVRVAYEIQRGMLKFFPTSNDRGVKPSRFYVLRHASCPAILMEVGFISNNREGRSLCTAATQDKIIKAILNGLVGYTGALRRTAGK